MRAFWQLLLSLVLAIALGGFAFSVVWCGDWASSALWCRVGEPVAGTLLLAGSGIPLPLVVVIYAFLFFLVIAGIDAYLHRND